jgi:hypothetical protein
LLAEDAFEGARHQAAIVDSLGDLAARARLQGLSARQILKLFEGLSDGKDRAMVRLIDQEVEEGFPTLRLAQDADNRQHLPALVAAVRARRAARVPAEVRALELRRAKVMDAKADFYVRHLLDRGRNVAKLPKPRRVTGV